MVESIRNNGVLNPILVQPIEGGKYEILSGHNRVEGAKTVGLNTIPAVVKENLSEEEAEMYVIETNLIQRGFNELLISEQAHVLKVQHSKMFSQGKRNDIIAELERLEKGLTSSPLGKKLSGETSLSKVGNEYGMSKNTVARLLRVNYLIQPFKDLTDNKAMPLRVAVELSYIPEDGQQMLYDVLTAHKKKLNIKQSKEVRQLFASGEVTTETLENLIVGEKPKKKYKNRLYNILAESYSIDCTERDLDELVLNFLTEYFSKR
jgi:ParB family chromosome partitioning protein